MTWTSLMIAGVFEVVWSVGSKYSHGFSRLVPSIITVVGMIISFLLLSYSTKTLLLGSAYTIWTGVGVVSAVIAGIFLFKEPVSLLWIMFVLFILIGI